MLVVDSQYLEEWENAEDEVDEDDNYETVIYQPTLFEYFEEDNTSIDPNIIFISDSRWSSALEEFRACSIFAFDIETYGAESWHPLFFYKNKIRLLQVGLPSGICLMADLGGWLNESPKETLKEYSEFLDILGQKLFDPAVPVIGTNLKFDFTTVREHFGFIGRQARDLMILSQILWAGVAVEKAKAGENRAERCKISHGFKAIAERLGFGEVDKTQQSSNWGWKLSNKQFNYAAKDVLLALEIYKKMKDLVVAEGLKYTAFVECNAVSVFSEMEFRGAPVNIELAKELYKDYEKERDEWVVKFQEHFPEVLWTSNKQVLEAFIEKIPGFLDIFKEGEKPSVSAEVLNQLDHPACVALLYSRMLTTSMNNIKIYIENSFRGSIRGFYRQIAPGGSGRTTCSAKLTVNNRSYKLGAQLQNPPNMIRQFKGKLRPVREIIQAPEGYVFGIFDGAQMHMRIASQLSRDPVLVKIFQDDFDGHSLLASTLAKQSGKNWTPEFISGVLGKGPRDEKWNLDKDRAKPSDEEESAWLPKIVGTCKDFRDKSKTVLYSCLNGSTAGRITSSMISDGLEWFTYDHGKELFSNFKRIYPNLVEFISGRYDAINRTSHDFSGFKTHDGKPVEGLWGRMKTLTGRIIYYKKYPSRFKKGQLEVSYTDATASNWLLPEADMIKAWSVEVFNLFLDNPKWEAYICNLVHDEINVVIKEEYALEAAIQIREKMRQVFGRWLTVIPPLEEADPKSFICQNWSQK
jgi:DNA polymerase I-like protein with 3'-5' exonuclease and polymerase domains